jgi:hypothetical protein
MCTIHVTRKDYSSSTALDRVNPTITKSNHPSAAAGYCISSYDVYLFPIYYSAVLLLSFITFDLYSLLILFGGANFDPIFRAVVDSSQWWRKGTPLSPQ